MAQRKKEPALSPAAAGATVLTGGLLAFGVCLAVLAGAAGLMAVGKLGEGATFRACCLGAALGGFVGGLYAALCCKSRLLPVALAAAGVSFLLWLRCTALSPPAARGRCWRPPWRAAARRGFSRPGEKGKKADCISPSAVV
ncbi:MAG: YrzE family protein [Clostridiales bacterium]|nr:YrzE family protein [Clostridiales bacterium]